jgi:hypothetical protein
MDLTGARTRLLGRLPQAVAGRISVGGRVGTAADPGANGTRESSQEGGTHSELSTPETQHYFTEQDFVAIGNKWVTGRILGITRRFF